MPEKRTLERAKRDKRQGKAASTQAGEFVREEMDHIREGKHGARSTKQAIAIGLSKARRAGVKLKPPKKGRTSDRTRKQAERDLKKGQSGEGRKKPSAKRSRAVRGALKREGRSAASRSSLSKQAKSAAAARKKRGTVTSGAGRKKSSSSSKKSSSSRTKTISRGKSSSSRKRKAA
jgi:hypothetical protein